MPETVEPKPSLPAAPPSKPLTPPSAPATGTDVVTVACKIPNGLILQVFNKGTDYETLVGGAQKPYDKFWAREQTYTLRGASFDQQDVKAGRFPDLHVGGYALTHGIPRDFWELWKAQHHDHPALKNNLVFAADGTDRASGMARDRAEVPSGYERIDPDNPAKRTGIKGITRGTRA